jgi:hypothetical protein
MPPRKPAKDRNDRSANLFFALAALVGTALLLAVIFQARGPARTSVGVESVSPDAATLLPPGAATSDASMAAVPADPQPTWFIGYELDGQGRVALVEWDRRRHRYAVTADAALSAGASAVTGMPSVAVEPLGTGAPAIIVAAGPHGGAYTDGIVLLLREGSSLRVLASVGADGVERPAFFLRGSSAMNEESFELRDLDADGVKEIAATSSSADGNGAPTYAVTVYRWQEGRFALDQELSWAYTTSRNLFPEPPNP